MDSHSLCRHLGLKVPAPSGGSAGRGHLGEAVRVPASCASGDDDSGGDEKVKTWPDY